MNSLAMTCAMVAQALNEFQALPTPRTGVRRLAECLGAALELAQQVTGREAQQAILHLQSAEALAEWDPEDACRHAYEFLRLVVAAV